MGSACRTANPISADRITSKNFVVHQSDMLRCTSHDVKSDYNFLGKLGEGGQGEVKKAIHKLTNISRAVKVILKDTAGNKRKETLMKEVNMLRETDHPNALRVIEYYDDSCDFYMVFEMLKGGNLYDKWKTGVKYSEARVAEMMREILSTVNYLHNKGIVHRDIKMDNINFVTEDSESMAKLCDFGIAIRFDPKIPMTEKKGTLMYLAPEILKGKYNEKCDIWASGVIIFMLLSGQPPFDGFDNEQVTKRILRAELSTKGKAFEKVSEEAKDLLHNMLQADITKRYSAQDCLNHAWFQKMPPPEEVEKGIDLDIMERVAKFSGMSKLKHAFWAFFISYLAPPEDKIKIAKTWNALDRRGRGLLSKDDLKRGFEIAFKNQKTVDFDTVFRDLDINGCGSVEYTGFLNAAFDKVSFLNDTRLHQMFKLFDKNEDNLISIEEFKEFLTPNKKLLTSPEHAELINQVGQEFKDMMSFETFKSAVLKHFGYTETPAAS